MHPDRLDERYFDWLYEIAIPSSRHPETRTYQSLLRQMHGTIFVAVVPYDENRVSDAKELRYEFLDDLGVEEPRGWTSAPSTFLELLVVLSRHLAFETDEVPSDWFVHLLENLGLEAFQDKSYGPSSQNVVERALDRVIWRTYSKSGAGGLFPLKRPAQDQREVELWYQLNAYLIEQF